MSAGFGRVIEIKVKEHPHFWRVDIDCHHVQRVALNKNKFVNESRSWLTSYAN